jgi:hypothetical protein
LGTKFLRTHPDRPRSPPSLLYKVAVRGLFPEAKRMGLGVKHPSTCSAEVQYWYSYISTSPLCLLGMLQDSPLFSPLPVITISFYLQ